MALPVFLHEIVDGAGLSRATGENMLKDMRAHAQVPIGKKFGSPVWELDHLTNFTMGLMGPQATDAAQVTEAFAGCRYSTSPGGDANDQQPRRGPGTFSEVLSGMIEQAARAVARREEMEAAGDDPWATPAGHIVPHPGRLPDQLTFCTNPLRIDLAWFAPNDMQEKIDVYAPRPRGLAEAARELPPWRGSTITRTATMPKPFLLAVGKVWLGMLRRRGVALPSAALTAGGEIAPAPAERDPTSITRNTRGRGSS